MATLITKNSSTASSVPTAAQLVQGELAVNVTDKRLFTENSSGTVVELGTNPSTLALPNGSANGVAYLNGSKVLTTGSALQFNGTDFGLGGTPVSVGVAGMPAYAALSATSGRSGAFYWQDTGANNVAYSYFFGSVFQFGTATNHPVAFMQSGSEQMRLTSTGLGIGTSSPGVKLDVVGIARSNTSFDLNNGTVTGTYGAGAFSAGVIGVGSTSNHPLVFGTNSSERMRLDSSGNLGLGTSSPDPFSWGTSIGINNASYSALSLKVGDVGKAYVAAGSGAMYIGGPVPVLFYTGSSGNGTERARIDSSGNLGVGTTTPQAKFVVSKAGAEGLEFFPGDSSNLSRILAYNRSGATRNDFQLDGTTLQFLTGGTERARIDSGGDLLVGTTSQITGEKFAADTTGGSAKAITARNDAGAGAATIFVWNAATSGDNLFVGFGTEANGAQRGTITYNRGSGVVAYNTTSDYRAKDIIGPVADSGSVIDSVPVYMGKMKGATQERPMFIAHETPPYAHTGEKDAVDADGNPVFQQMDASALVPVLWAEVQSLRKRVAALESK